MNDHSLHYFNLKSELKMLFTSISIRTFAKTLINIYVPIYLIQLGYSIEIVLLYCAIRSLGHGIITYPAGKLASHHGLMYLIIISIPLLILSFLGLYTLPIIGNIGLLVLILGFIEGISEGMFWVGHHTKFAEIGDKDKLGKEIGMVKILISISTALGPLAGAFLLTYIGFQWVFIIVTVILFLSVIPLLKTKHKKEQFNLKIKDFIKVFNWRDYVGHFGFGVESSIQNVIWPIFIFFFILNQEFTLLGSITSIALLFSLIMTYLIGKFVDKKPNLLNDIGAILTGAVWIIRNFVSTGLQVFAIDSVAGFSRTTQNISFNRISYQHSRKKELAYIAYRESIINVGHVATYLLLILFVGNYSLAFFLGMIGSFMFLFFRA